MLKNIVIFNNNLTLKSEHWINYYLPLSRYLILKYHKKTKSN